MKNLSHLFDNLFNDANITNNRLVSFGTDQIVRLTANNPGGIYTTIITETSSAINSMKSLLLLNKNSKSTRKGSTVTKNQARNTLTAYISQQEGLIKSTFGKKSHQYKEFFPSGLKAFHHLANQNYDYLTNVIVEKALKYQTALGTPFTTEITLLYTAWHTTYNQQGEATVTTDTTASQLQTAALALRLQLTKNSLIIAGNNVDNQTAYQLYFDTTLLFAQHRTHFYKGVAAINSTATVHKITYHASTQFHIKNKGAVTISFQLWLAETPVGNSFTVETGATLHKPMSEFFSVGDTLRVTNPNSTPCAFEVRQVA